MTDLAQETVLRRSVYKSEAFEAQLRRRYRAERRFQLAGIASIAFAAVMLVVLLTTIVLNGYTAFWQSRFDVEVFFDPEAITPSGSREPAVLSAGDVTAAGP
jgi:phosphate transport system permease protein